MNDCTNLKFASKEFQNPGKGHRSLSPLVNADLLGYVWKAVTTHGHFAIVAVTPLRFRL
jgi:hypothetical protein